MKISRETARRYVLGKQGLWPGKRWKGKSGTEQAMRAVEYVQLDPLNICARSHDLLLHSRVVDYKPQYFHDIAYKERKFFDWGHWLAARPIEEFAYMRPFMKRSYDQSHRKHLTKTYDQATKFVLEQLKTRGPLGNRDFEGLARVESYRGRKDTAIALFDLWMAGQVITHERKGFERVYSLAENIRELANHPEISNDEAELFIAKKQIAFYGLSRLHTVNGLLHRNVTAKDAVKLRDTLLERGAISQLEIEGWKQPHFFVSEDLAILKTLEAGKIPKAWKPVKRTTEEEVAFLAPLDNVSARGRSKQLFDFDYVWEVYKPEHQRKWGYYVLPVLWGDKLVARLDPKLDRTTNTLHVLGFWTEDAKILRNQDFLEALKNGFESFSRLIGNKAIKISGPGAATLRKTGATSIKF